MVRSCLFRAPDKPTCAQQCQSWSAVKLLCMKNYPETLDVFTAPAGLWWLYKERRAPRS